MLEIQNVEIINFEKLNIKKKKNKKTQILLYDTQRRFEHFINKLKYRYDGAYDDVPHFVVSKNGVIHKICDLNYSSKTFGDEKFDKRFIKICFENLGWLNKDAITGVLYNWINDPYRAEPHSRPWRNYFYWDKYTDEQIKSGALICKKICEDLSLPNNIVPSQGYIEDLNNFKGIVCKSNFSDIYTDINPSFDFKKFKEYVKE